MNQELENLINMVLAKGELTEKDKEIVLYCAGYTCPKSKQAFELFIKHRPPFMTHLLLSHLSQENNSPKLAESVFAPYTNGTKIIVAPRHEATEVFTITHPELNEDKIVFKKPVQLGLFE